MDEIVKTVGGATPSKGDGKDGFCVADSSGGGIRLPPGMKGKGHL